MRFQHFVIPAILLGLIPKPSAGQNTLGAEFRINTSTTGDQQGGRVAMDGRGGFVVVWQSQLTDIVAQRYAPDGSPRGGELKLNLNTTTGASDPDVASDPDGNAIVVWRRGNSPYPLYGRRISSSGVIDSSEFQVNAYTTTQKDFPAIAMAPDGRFVVAWQDAYNTIKARVFQGVGTPLCNDLPVSSGGSLRRPSVAWLPSVDRFVVGWHSDQTHQVRARVFSATAPCPPFSGEFTINDAPPSLSNDTSLASDSTGNFVAAWTQGSGEANVVFARRFGADGIARGLEFEVDAASGGGNNKHARVAMSPSGEFVLTWHATNGAQDVFGRSYRSDATPLEGPFLVNSYTTGSQTSAAVAMIGPREFTIAWTSAGQDGSGNGVYGKRYGTLRPAALAVDSAGNGVLERDEAANVAVAPSWTNLSGTVQGPIDGSAFQPLTPPAVTCPATDVQSYYGSIGSGATAACSTNNDCYAINCFVTGTSAGHADATFLETLNSFDTKRWTLHLGKSFTDVPPTNNGSPNAYYKFIETVLHRGVPGCTTTTYCPVSGTSREDMARFLLRGKEGPGYTPPACTTQLFTDVPLDHPLCPWINELATRGITGGCGGGLYCPTGSVTRDQMAVFLLVTKEGTGYQPPTCTTPMFTDVPCSSPYARWINELARRGITGGCGGGNYCPTTTVKRQEMAVFVSTTFGLTLYGP